MNAQDVRSESDRALSAELLQDPTVKRLAAQLESMKKEQGASTRRSLLAQALRLTPAVAPGLNDTLKRCGEVLGMEARIEAFVYPSAQLNAACTDQEGERVFILFSSALLEAFDSEELAFVSGHEVGHHVYRHHDLPLPLLFSGKVKLAPDLLLKAYSWQRHAEISADRAGLLCCGGLGGAARSLFKLSSGLTRAPDQARLDAFVEQAEELYRESEEQGPSARMARRDWLSSHPFSPLRLRAAQAFCQGSAMVSDGLPMVQVETRVLELMSLMEPSYLQIRSDWAEAMRRLLFAAGLSVAAVSGGVSPEERNELEKLLGPGRVSRNIDLARIEEDIPRRIKAVQALVPPARRAQLIRDLSLIARADGMADEAECAMIRRLASSLEVSPALVDAALSSPTGLGFAPN